MKHPNHREAGWIVLHKKTFFPLYTFETSQSPIGWLNCLAQENILFMVCTFETSHSPIVWLNCLVQENIFSIVYTIQIYLSHKIDLKDFDKNQYKKYKVALDEFKIVYLIGKDCVIHLTTKHIYTTDLEKYQLYILNIPSLKLPSYLDIMILEFEISKVEDTTNYISL